MEPAASRAASASPESLGVPSRAVLRFLDRLAREGQDHHAFCLLRPGGVAVEGAFAPYRTEVPHRMFSVSKSVTSLGIGFLAQEGLLGLGDRVADRLPEGASACTDPLLAGLTVRDLLTMATGQETDPIFSLGSGGTWVETFFRTPCVEPPGRTFRYNSTATHVLSALVSALAGRTLTEYLRPRLFEPLGIGPVASEMSPEGACAGGWGMFLRVGDLARLGWFALRRGVWEGRRLLSAEYLDEATSLRIASDRAPDDPLAFGHGYGYQFWRCPDGGFRMDGAFGQTALVRPDRDAVLAATNGLDDAPRFFRAAWDLLGECAPGPLPEDPEAFRELSARLSGLRHELAEGSPASPMEPGIDGVRYVLPPNPYGHRAVRVRSTERGVSLRLETRDGAFEAEAGRDGRFRRAADGWDRTLLPWVALGALPPFPPVTEETWVAARWTAEDALRFCIRFPGSSACDDWTLSFREGGRRCVARQRPRGIMEFAERPALAGVAGPQATEEE